MKTYPKVSYKEVFTANLPMGEQYMTEDKIDCVMCDELIDPDDRGCIKCLGQEESQ